MPNVLCPYCARPTILPEPWPHPGFVCPHCRASVALAAPTPPPPPTPALPANPFAIDDDASVDEASGGYGSESRYKPSRSRRSRQTGMGQANRTVASVGAALLLIGQFLPMVNAPLGIWLSFVDLPWKAVTIGLNAAAEAEEDKRESRQNRTPPPRVEQPDKKASDASKTVTAVIGIAILYPVCIFVMVAIAFFQICGGTSRGVFTLTGGISLAATLFYGIALLALSAQKEFRVVMAFISPGFGWAVVVIGALALTGSG